MHRFHDHDKLHRFFGRGDRGGFGRGHFGRHKHGRGGGDIGDASGFIGRILGHGDLRYVILALLNEKPSHGYELIKSLEEKSMGHYSPSPGVIYPTLTFLEESGFATSTTEDNKKLYTITPEGQNLLKENDDVVLAIFEKLSAVGEKMSRLREWFGKEESSQFMDRESREYLKSMMHQLKAELFSKIPISKERQKSIADIIAKAIQEIRDLK